MITGLWNGISGVNTQQQGLNVQSNNIANVNTVGHKSDSVSFEDMLYQNGIGKGVSTQEVRKDFSEGNLKNTGNDYDFAVDGRGFFMIQDPNLNETFYTRAGNFKMGPNGNLLTANNFFVQGITSGAPAVISSNATKTQFDSSHTQFMASQVIDTEDRVTTINARATNYNESATATGVSGDNYKTKGALISDIEALKVDYREKLSLYGANPQAASVASVAQETQVNFPGFATLKNGDSIEVTINGDKVRQSFDTDAQTTMNKLADQIAKVQGLEARADTNGMITVTGLVPGKEYKLADAKINDTVVGTVTDTVTATTGSGLAMIESSRTALQTALENAGAELLDMTNTINLTGQESLTTSNIQLKLDTLNISEQGFGDLEAVDGVLYIKQGDSKFAIGKLSTATFNNLEGLNPKGDNYYAATESSGAAIWAGNSNTIASKTLELSNSDLSVGLTDLMVYQRAFEASAKSITTSDQFLDRKSVV